MKAMSEPSPYSLVLAIALTAIAAAWDLRTGKIPNRLLLLGTLCAAGAALASAVESGDVLRTLLGMVAGVVLVSLVPALLYRAGGIGGGDLKLLALLGASLGPYLGLEAELYAFVVALIYAPARLIWEGRLGQQMRTVATMAVRPLLPRARRPAPVPVEELTALRFAPAIFVGTLTAAVHHLGGGQ
jgi:prepilin peptidase CpaA